MTRRPLSVFPSGALKDRVPSHALVENVDLVLVRFDDQVRAFYGRCLHRGALLADGQIVGDDIVCGLHGWDFRMDTGVSAYNNAEALERFACWEEDGQVWVDAAEIAAYAVAHPQPFDRSAYLGDYADTHPAPEEPYTGYIDELARKGAKGVGHDGRVEAMGVPLNELPRWEDIQILTAQLHRRPLAMDVPVDTELVIGPHAKKPLRMAIPLFVSDMSFGALSEEAKVALAKGAQGAGTGICSGEGGMLPEEQASNDRYLYELASGKFGWSLDKVRRVQAFHFKAGQGAKTGTGGHLPGRKVTGRIAAVRGLPVGEDAISPPAFPDLHTVADFRRVADEVRDVSGGIPIGFKLSAQHVELDIDFALDVGCDYIILDGRGGATGAAPAIFRNNISVPTMAALARARRALDRKAPHVTLIVTGGLRTESHFVKAMAMGADGVAVSNAALQAIGCLGMRACQTNNCPVGIATQKEHLRKRLIVAASAQRLTNYFEASVQLMTTLARACGHTRLADFCMDDLTTWKRDIAYLSGVRYAGVAPL